VAHPVRTLADRLIGLSATIGALALGVEVCVILADVAGRAMGRPLYGSQDVVSMAMVGVVFGAMALCDRQGGHIVVDILENRFSSGFNRWMDIISALTGTTVFLFIAWAVWDSAKLSVMLNLQTNLLGLPKSWFQWMLAGFAVLTALGMLMRAFELAVLRRDIRKTPSEVRR
jgi:TRAP-type C4-dicarboxylate transport system permease small subunit